jgi:hypothetical protein
LFDDHSQARFLCPSMLRNSYLHNGGSIEPPWVDLIFHCRSASERRKISPTQVEIAVSPLECCARS